MDLTGSHRRQNILTGEWVLVSPHRMDRPWQGEVSLPSEKPTQAYSADCPLCPGNKRSSGEVNPRYERTFVFTNDFPAFKESGSRRGRRTRGNGFLVSRPERGTCRVVNYSPRHDMTLADLNREEISNIIQVWQEEFVRLSEDPDIRYVQIFENKGLLMGTSNPHPHCQIWAQESIPTEVLKEQRAFERYRARKNRSLLGDYLKVEMEGKERVVYENDAFVVVVPFWATWPFETMLIPRRRMSGIREMDGKEQRQFADAIKVITVKYDNLFKTSFPYSAGIHQAPCDGKRHSEWHLHMHFYPPLLRSASIRKFMVGYEMLAEPQRDLTPEVSAGMLRDLPVEHYRHR